MKPDPLRATRGVAHAWVDDSWCGDGASWSQLKPHLKRGRAAHELGRLGFAWREDLLREAVRGSLADPNTRHGTPQQQEIKNTPGANDKTARSG